MENKSTNAAIVVIALAVIVIVAMVCGMVMWIMQRTMSMNEKLLDVRLAEARSGQPAHPQPEVPSAQRASGEAVPQVTPQSTAPVRVQPPMAIAPTAPQPNAATSPTAPSPRQSATPTPKPVPSQPEPVKRKAPQERKDAKVGPDGQPVDRITLPVGNDDLDWQF